MAAYFIADVEITDPEEYRRYAQLTGPIVERYGGKFLAVDAQPETTEGDWHSKRIIIMEFESVEKARAWYDSPEYSAIAGMRYRSANSNVILVKGL